MPPGHYAWVVGDEPCVFIDWQGFADYAERRRLRRDNDGASGCRLRNRVSR
jgi:hypothetical protein